MSNEMQHIEFSSASDLKVERFGGRWKSGIIKNFAVLTIGVEAKGHGLMVDEEFGEEVATALSAKAGIKSRLTHVQGDGITAGLGRVMFSKTEDGKVYGDLHFWASAHKSPAGNLADFVMTKAEEDPTAFGSSIGFVRDIEREDWSEEKPYVRLKELKYVDIVDSPATNPEGLFNESDDAVVAELIKSLESKGFTVKLNNEADFNEEVKEEVLEEVELESCDECGEDCECHEEAKSEEAPAEEATEEVAEEVVAEVVAEEAPAEEVKEEESRGHFMEQLKEYTDLFGAAEGLELFTNGVSMADAQSQFIAKQNQIIADLKNKLDVEMSSSEAVGQAGEVKASGFASRIKH